MGWLLDTNVVSELRKSARADPNVVAWSRAVRNHRQWISVLSLGEIHKGIEIIRRSDSAQARALEAWVSELKVLYWDSILPICENVAGMWGRLQADRSLPVIDGLLAATARVHHLRLATRNLRDFEGLGLEVVNPFDDPT